MRTLSAAEAVGPAWERTRQVLFEPFSVKRYLKLALVATLAGTASVSINWNNHMSRYNQHAPMANPFATKMMVVVMAMLMIIIPLILGIAAVLFYISCRMQFVLFGIVATKTSEVAPFWRQHGGHTWRWLFLRLVLGFALIAVLLSLVLPPVLAFLHHDSQMGHRALFNLIFRSTAALLIVLAFSPLFWLMRDFMLPVIALEDADIGSAFARLGMLLQVEPGEFFLYLLLKFVLALAFTIASFILMFLLMLIAAIPIVIVCALLFFASKIAAIVLGVLIFLVVYFCIIISIYGFSSTFFQAYALFFYGGRYPLLGNLLEPPAADPLHWGTAPQPLVPPPAPV